MPTQKKHAETSSPHPSRRKFLMLAGGTGLAAAGLASCQKVWDWPRPGHGHGHGDTVDLGSGDVGILNYAYALEQLEAAFYTKVMERPYHGMSSYEKELLTDIMYHEIAHREFFRTALGDNRIPDLEVDFHKINFNKRDSVLETAKTFEDLGVSAYNGAGHLIDNSGYLLLAGKIVSVEARHAAAVRDLIDYGSFADNSVIDQNGLDTSRMPGEVLPLAQQFLKTQISGDNLPS